MPASADLIAVRYYKETAFATPPGTVNMTELRITGESLKQQQTMTPSTEIREDRQIVDVIRTNASGTGGWNYEWSYGTYDDLLEGAFCQDGWTSSATENFDGATDIITVSTVDGKSRLTITSGAKTFANFPAGGWIKLEETPTTPGVNGIYKIAAREDPGQTYIDLDYGTIADGALADVTLTLGEQLVNSTDLVTYGFEREFTDLSGAGQFALNDGCAIDNFNWSCSADGIINGSFGVIGSREVSGALTVRDGSLTAAPFNDVQAGVDDVAAIFEDGSSFDVREISIQLNNNVRERLRIGTLGAFSLGLGTLAATGTLSFYYDGAETIDKFLQDTASRFAIVNTDAAGNTYVFDMPSIRFTDGSRNATGQNTDIMVDGSYSAFRDPTEGITLRCVRFPAA